MRTLTENLGLKLLALAIAIASWLTYARETEVATSIGASLQYRNVPRDLEVSSDAVDRMYLKVRGPSALLSAASLAESAIVLDLSSVSRPGERTFTVGAQNVHLPPGVQLLRVTPSQVRLHFDRRGMREVPVRVRIGSGPPPGYRLAWHQAIPQRVRVIGPAARVAALEVAETDPVHLGATYGRADFRSPVFLGDPMVRLERDEPVTVRVSIEKNN